MELGIDIPVSLSMKHGEPNSIFSRIVCTAENPHLSIPETESGRRSKNIRQLVNSSLLFVSGYSSQNWIFPCLSENIESSKLTIYYMKYAVGTAVGFAGLAAYRAYAARKNA